MQGRLRKSAVYVPLPDDPDPNPGGAGTPAPTPTPTAATPPGEERVSEAKATALKAEGERRARQQLAEAVGMSPAEIVEYVKAKRAEEEQAKSEEQKRLDELKRREDAAAERERQAAARERQALIRAALAQAGSTGDNLADAARLVDVPDDADEAAITAAVEKVKTRRPELFGQPPTPGIHTVPSDPPNGRTVGTSGSSKIEEGRRIAREMGWAPERQTA